MSAFGSKKQIIARPAGESDEEGSSDEDDFDMPGFLKKKKQRFVPSSVQINGGNTFEGGDATSYNIHNNDDDEKDWGPAPAEVDNGPPPRVEDWGQTQTEEVRLACVRGNLDRLKSALEKGEVGVDDFLSDEYTPLMTAAAHTHPHLVEFLISEKADVTIYHYQHKVTALIAAASSAIRQNKDDVLQCVRLLVEASTNLQYLNHQDKNGLSALGCSVMKKRDDIIQYLLDSGANPDLIDSIGRTCLAYAAEMGEGRICRILLEKGADVDIVDDSGWSAIELANDKGFYRLAELLHIVRDTKWIPGKNPSLMQEIDEEAAVRRLNTPVAEGVTVREDSQIEILLGSFAANKYIDNFRKHRITYLQFLELDEEKLKEIGIDELGIRKKLVDSIREIHNQEWQQTSIRSVALNKKITAAESVCMVNNIKQHLQYISKSLVSMRTRIQKDPQCLQYGKERNKLQDLISLCKEMNKGNEGLEKEVIELIRYLKTIEGYAEFKLGDEVKPKSVEAVKAKWDSKNNGTTSGYKWIVGTGVVLLVVLFASRGRIRNVF